MQEDALNKYKMWEGWREYFNLSSVVLGPDGKRVDWPAKQQNDVEVRGFAYPLPPVDLYRRNERRFPPPTHERNFREAYSLLVTLQSAKGPRRSMVWQCVYDRVNSNSRDSPRWQVAFLEAGGSDQLIKACTGVPAEADDNLAPHKKLTLTRDLEGEQQADVVQTERYLVIAIMGRMIGTSQESRVRLIKDGAVDCILEGTADLDPEVQACAIAGLKALVFFPEGRQVVDYTTLMSCLDRAVKDP